MDTLIARVYVIALIAGKKEKGESDEVCLHREIKEELGCDCSNLKYWETFFDKTHDGKELELRAYFGDLVGEIKLNPEDNIDGFIWVEKNYYPELKLASLIKHKIIPSLVERGLI